MIRIIILLMLVTVMLTACESSPPPSESETTPPPELLMQGVSFPSAPTTEPLPHPDAVLYRPLNHNEVIGVWVSFIELSGILMNRTESQFRENYIELLENCLSLGINTVYVHLRPFGDALYESEHFPPSKYVSGQVGRVPAFDPLELMIEETHARGISFHGWLNPMRIQSSGDMGRVSEDYLTGQWYACADKRGTYIVEHSGNWYLNPAYPAVRALIAEGAREIVEGYNVDGLHIDDYFYPTTATTFDEAAFREFAGSFGAESGFDSLAEFRRANINGMVRELFAATKSSNPNVLFGISPAGGIDNNVEQLFADVELWTRNIGFADYIAPQIYFGFENESLPFAATLAHWQSLAEGSPTRLIIGLAVYKIGREDTFAGTGSREWLEESEILRRQIELSREISNYGGVAFFSYNFLFNPTHLNNSIRDELAAMKETILSN